MDLYTAALKRLRADPRSARALSEAMDGKIKGRAIHAIKKGESSFDKIRFGTVKCIAKMYFPKEISA